MSHNKEAKEGATDQGIFLDNRMQGEASLIPWPFQHHDLIRRMASADYIDKNKLTNILNHLHFRGDHLYALLNHPRYREDILVVVYPDPCLGDTLNCQWDPAYKNYNLEEYPFQYLIVSYGQSMILVPARIHRIQPDGLTVQLPDQSLVIGKRQSPRFACSGAHAELWQSGFQVQGELIDFSAQAFRIRLQPQISFQWLNTEAPMSIRLWSGQQVLFSEDCRCLFLKQEEKKREMVLTPLRDQIQRFKGKTLRNPRRRSLPPFYALFEHPFTGKRLQREIYDISTSGFSIQDKDSEAILMAGMIIPHMTITYAGILKIHCKAQVIYSKKEDDPFIRFGIAILDMDIKNYNILNQCINNMPGMDEGMINEVDTEQLWELFFETNFIYPGKYKHIQAFRSSFQETYRKLYEETPEIAKHFTYQKNGRLYSHISMIRAYERTWMLHHHAARAKEGRHTGMVVLKRMIGYLFDMRRFPSGNLDYFMCYYRPGNKFTDRVYSGFAREYANPALCSLDLFAYLSYTIGAVPSSLLDGWSLQQCSSADLWELERFYKHHSGGLLCSVLFGTSFSPDDSIEKTYAQKGFHRQWQLFALYHARDLKAVLIKEESDAALNLSDLLNGVRVLVMDPATPAEIIFRAVEAMGKPSPSGSFPVLFYPADYMQNQGLESDKQYCLWILDARIGNEFVEYLGRKFRTNII